MKEINPNVNKYLTNGRYDPRKSELIRKDRQPKPFIKKDYMSIRNVYNTICDKLFLLSQQ